jgi:hypothetical protein
MNNMEIISLLLKNDLVISPQPIIPFCSACHQDPKPIRTIQENQKFLNGILTNIQNQLSEQEFLTVRLANQDQPDS